MNTNSTFKLKTGILVQDIDDEMILLDPATDAYYGINVVGFAILDEIKAEHALTDIVAHITAEFEIDEKTARDDVEGFINSLVSNGLLVQT